MAIIDIGLPGMNGYEVAKSIRREQGDNPTLVTDRLRASGGRATRAQCWV
ncbi:MAG: response regulator [Betaproteobacteria bacterium]|nr:response regulator [Betaproteobacteria bacterium]